MPESVSIKLNEIYEFSSCVFFILISPDLPFDICSESASAIRVQDLSEALSILPVESQLSLTSCMDKSIAERSAGEVEFFFDNADGGTRWFLAKLMPVGSGKLQCLFMDISSLKAREQHADLVMNELVHRIKNNMAVVQSIARLTLKSAQPDEQALATFLSRLGALANAHNLLLRNQWQGASLLDVVIAAINPFDRDLSPFCVSGDNVLLPSRLAKTMIFALHELCTNAMKYGALGVPNGEILVSWRVLQDREARTLLFSWEERSGPAIHSTPARRGFGTRMIERWLTRESGGTATITYREEGLLFELSAPLPKSDDVIAAGNAESRDAPSQWRTGNGGGAVNC